MNIALFLSASDYKLSDGALYALIGFIIVLLVLALLVGIFYLTGFLFRHTPLGKEKLFERKKGRSEVSPTSHEESDDEIIAAITAAITAIYESESDGGEVVPGFVIRHIKRNGVKQ